MDEDDQVAKWDEMPDVADFFMASITESYMEAKREITRNGPADLEPRVMYMPISLDALMGMIPVMIGDVLDPPNALGIALTAARAKFGPPALVMFVSEAYMKVFEEHTDVMEEMKTHKRGDWVDDPQAVECLTIHLAHLMPDRITVRYLFRNIPFHYEDGTVTFGEAVIIDSEAPDAEIGEGAMYDVIHAAFSAANN